ncbi:MAG: hypothetical protein ABFD66_07920 [Smithella sp.]
MLDNTKNKNIVHFVQNTLGCQCAEEVFNSIELGKGSTPNGEAAFAKMVIGNRLLIYIVQPLSESENLINNLIPILTEMGILERDNKGYNRFRLVLAKQSDDVISDNLIKDFQKTAGHDEKAHIHFVSQQELPNVPEIA